MSSLSILLFVFLFNYTITSIYGLLSPSIPHFTQSNFHNQVMNVEQTTLVLFYAPWCGHCKQFKPQYEPAARKLNGIAIVGAVNCDEQKQLCAEAGIQGFPSLKCYYTNAKSRKRITVEYKGDRTTTSVVSFAQSRIPNFVKPIRTDGMTLDKFYSLHNTTLPKVMVIKPPSQEMKPTSALLKALAIDYHYRLLFGEVTGQTVTDPLYDEINVLPPTSGVFIHVIQPNSNQVIPYTGEIKQDQLRSFFNQYALTDKADTTKKKVEDESNKMNERNEL